MNFPFLYGAWKGPQIERFVQSYTTIDINSLSDSWRVTLCLDRQGRVVACIALKIVDSVVYFACPQGVYSALEEHLRQYCKISRVSTTLYENSFNDVFFPQRIYPWITRQEHSGVWTAHDLSADILGLISFTKGCYLGQEVVARVQSRIFNHKKRLVVHCLKLDKSLNEVLYFQSELAISVLPRIEWILEEIIHVWDKPEDNDFISLDSIKTN